MGFMRPIKLLLAAITFATIAIGLGACGGGGAAGSIKFSHRFTNVIADLGGLDFYVDDVLKAPNLAFGGSSAYEKITDSARTEFIDVNDAGTSNVLDSIEVDRVNDQSINVFALGLATPGSQQPGLRLLPVTVNRIAPSGNNARVIVVHGFIRDVGFPTPNIDLHRTPDIIEVSDLPFGESGSFLVSAGTYDFTVRITGIEDSVLIFKPGVVIQGNKVYVMILQGIENGGGAIIPDIQLIEQPPKS